MTDSCGEIEYCVEIDPAADLRVAADEPCKVGLFLPGPHGVILDEAVRIVAGEPGLDEREEEAMTEDEAVTRLEIAEHPLGMDDEAFDDPREAVEHVVECEERIGNDYALGRGLRDVALVPERHVLEPDQRIGAHDTGETTDALGHLRVALVRHCRGSLHPLAERFLDLAHLGAREMADLRCEAVERRRREREG